MHIALGLNNLFLCLEIDRKAVHSEFVTQRLDEWVAASLSKKKHNVYHVNESTNLSCSWKKY